MKCIYCGFEETSVVDSRETEDLLAVRRRRECNKCKRRFTTYERVDFEDLMVIKKDGRREKFLQEKLKNGIMKACEKRNISMEKIDEMVRNIETELRKDDVTEVSSKKLGEMVSSALKKLDKVAYIRFASVYKEFDDVTEFKKEVEKLKS
jgi:transcriptional repressor NrdR